MTFIHCPNCQIVMAIYTSRRLKNGSITRRYKCSKCGQRLTVKNDGDAQPYREFRGRHIPSCIRCVHRGSPCDLNIPEAKTVGPKFAKECAAWVEVERS